MYYFSRKLLPKLYSIIWPNVIVWLPLRFARNYAETVPFHKIFTPWNRCEITVFYAVLFTTLDKKFKLKFWERCWAGRTIWFPLYISSLLLKFGSSSSKLQPWNYSGTSLKRTLTGQKFLPALERCPPWRGLNWKVPKSKERLFYTAPTLTRSPPPPYLTMGIWNCVSPWGAYNRGGAYNGGKFCVREKE